MDQAVICHTWPRVQGARRIRGRLNRKVGWQGVGCDGGRQAAAGAVAHTLIGRDGAPEWKTIKATKRGVSCWQ